MNTPRLRSPRTPEWKRLATTLMVGLLAFCGCDGRRSDTRSDVILIVVDTLRSDHLGSYGYERDTSPHIDSLAADGVLFEQVVAASAFTGPAVAAILTGNYPRFSGFGFNDRAVLVEDQRTLAESFLSVGYRTAAFVGNPYVSKEFGFGQGFEVYDQEMPQLERVRGLPERKAGDTTDAALEWLGELGRHERVFLYIHYMDPHGPYTPPAEFLQRFTPERPGRRIPAAPQKGANSGRGFVPHYQDVVDSRGYDEYVGRYDAEISYMDFHLGRLLDWLKANGRYENAVILLTGDHGEALGEYGFYFSHGHSVTPDQTSVPMILKAPTAPPGTRLRVPVGHVDIFSTLDPVPSPDEGASDWLTGRSLTEATHLRGSGRPLYTDIGDQLGVRLGTNIIIGRVVGGLEREGEPGPGDFRILKILRLGEERIGVEISPDKRAALEREAQRYLAEPRFPVGNRNDDPALRERLRALGYSWD